MGSQRTKSQLRGFMTADPAWKVDNVWSTQSTYEEAGTLPGLPEVDSNSDPSKLRLVTAGVGRTSQTQVLCLQSGTGVRNSGRIGWKTAGDSNWRGWEPPCAVADWRAVDWQAGSGVGGMSEFYALATKDDTRLCAYRELQTTGPSTWRIGVARLERDGTETQINVASSLPDQDNHYPVLVQLPDGQIHLYFWFYESIRARWNVRAYTSDDDGASWSLLSAGVIKDGLNQDLSTVTGTVPYEAAGGSATDFSSVGRLAACYINGAVLLVGGLRWANTGYSNRWTLRQWASIDDGCTFDLVEGETTVNTNATDMEKDPQLIPNGDECYLTYIGGDSDFEWRILTNAHEAISGITEDSYDIPDELGWHTACIDDSGTVWIYLLHDDSGAGAYSKGPLYSSVDGMRNVIRHGISGSKTFWFDGLDSNGSDGELLYPTACFSRGQVALFHAHDWNGSSYDNSLTYFLLGGWSTVQLPGYYPTVNSPQQRTGWDWLWCPVYGVPDVGDDRWTSAGTGTDAIGSDALLQLTTTAANPTINYTEAMSDGSITVRALVYSDTLPGSTGECGIRMTCYDGSTNDYAIEIRVHDSGFKIQDLNAGSELHAEGSLSTASGLHLLASINDSGGLSVWYMIGDQEADYDWTEAYSTTSALTSAAGSASSLVWGHLTSPTGISAVSKWAFVAHNSGNTKGVNGALADGFDNPSDCFGAGVVKRPLYLVDGLRVGGVLGPALRGHQWLIPDRYSYAVDNIFPDVAPSPSQGWRSTATTEHSIAVDLLGLAGTAYPLSPVHGLYLKGINWKTGELQGYDGSWSTLVEIDTATDFTALPFTRKGNRLFPSATSHTADRYIKRGELVGCTVDLGSGDLRKITYNSGGLWTNSSTVKPYIVFDGLDNTEASSGTMDIWYDEVLVMTAAGASDGYRGYRILIDSQSTADGDHRIGLALAGPVHAMSKDYDFGHSERQAANVTLRETLGGQRKSKSFGPRRRSHAFAWTDGIDERALHQKDPDWLRAVAAGLPVSAWGDTALDLQGLHDHLDGPGTPLLYVASFDYDGDPWHITDKRRVTYGRMVGDLEVSNIIGDEDEQVRQVNTVVIEEEV